MSKVKFAKGPAKTAAPPPKRSAKTHTESEPVPAADVRDPFLKGLGKAVVDRRTQLQMTQMQLATAAGIGLSSVHHIETASSNTSLLTLLKVARALDTELRDLIPLHSTAGLTVKGANKRA